ncbi:MAG TPA: hypothetical protein VIW70_05775 [Rubrivivax sp.]
MNTQSLSSVTLETIENCRHAAELSVQTYRAGTRRLVGLVNDTLAKNFDSRTGLVAPKLTDKLAQVRGSLSDIIVKGVVNVSARTEQVIEFSSDSAAKGVTQVAEFAAGIENRVAANGIETVARLSMPGAEVARTLSAKVAEGAGKLSRVAAGKPVKAPRAAVKSVRKSAVSAKKAVVRKAVATKTAVARKATSAKRKVVRAARA